MFRINQRRLSANNQNALDAVISILKASEPQYVNVYDDYTNYSHKRLHD